MSYLRGWAASPAHDRKLFLVSPGEIDDYRVGLGGVADDPMSSSISLALSKEQPGLYTICIRGYTSTYIFNPTRLLILLLTFFFKFVQTYHLLV